MNTKTDIRIVKTNEALTSSLLSLMEDRPIEDITINEICDLAKTRRATFYQHFKDKYDLLAFIINKVRMDFLVKGLNEKTDIKEFCTTIVERSFKLFSRYRRLVKNSSNSPSFYLMENIFTQEIVMTVKAKIDESKNFFSYPGNSIFLANVFAGALVQVLKYWFRNEDRKEDEEKEIMKEMALFLSHL